MCFPWFQCLHKFHRRWYYHVYFKRNIVVFPFVLQTYVLNIGNIIPLSWNTKCFLSKMLMLFLSLKPFFSFHKYRRGSCIQEKKKQNPVPFPLPTLWWKIFLSFWPGHLLLSSVKCLEIRHFTTFSTNILDNIADGDASLLYRQRQHYIAIKPQDLLPRFSWGALSPMKKWIKLENTACWDEEKMLVDKSKGL